MIRELSASTSSQALPVWFDIFVMSLNALFGAALARSRNVPIYGTLFAGILVGLGGGMVRDVLLAQEPIAITQPLIIPFAIIGGLIGGLIGGTFFGGVLGRKNVFALAQGITLGFLVTIGAQKALEFDAPLISAIFLGIVTATFGGILADTMTGYRATVARQAHWVASAVTVGAALFVLTTMTIGFWPAVIVCVVAVAGLRFASQRRNWPSPRWPGESMDTPDTPESS